MYVHTDQFLTLLDVGRYNCLQEIHESLRMISLSEKEIYPVVHLLDIYCILVRSMLQYQLLEEQERSLMWDLLSHLDNRSPGVVRVTLRAVYENR